MSEQPGHESVTDFARELWRRLETLHAVTYFAPESREAAEAIGVRGFWRCYFGYRAAPLGECSAGVVTAAFFGFAPSMVGRALPAIWQLAPPSALLDARATSATTALRRLAGTELKVALGDGWVLDVLSEAARGGSPGGRPLYAANRALPLPDDPVAAIWQLATTTREHRGDGHVAAWTAEGLTPLEVAVLFVATGGTTREAIQPNRGWSDEEWADAEAGLGRRRLLDGGAASAKGHQMRSQIEQTTDDLASAPFAGLDTADRQRLLDALRAPARAIAAAGTIPVANPMGVRLLD